MNDLAEITENVDYESHPLANWEPVRVKLRPHVKAEWLEALRSGRYKQTKGVLQNDDGNCCLGVLCDIAAKYDIGRWDVKTYDTDQPGADPLTTHSFVTPEDGVDSHGVQIGATSMPPVQVIEWAFEGAPAHAANWFVQVPEKIEGDAAGGPASRLGWYTLPTLNDLGGYNFEQIADLIEEQM